jgi:hypothetical protein
MPGVGHLVSSLWIKGLARGPARIAERPDLKLAFRRKPRQGFCEERGSKCWLDLVAITFSSRGQLRFQRFFLREATYAEGTEADYLAFRINAFHHRIIAQSRS